MSDLRLPHSKYLIWHTYPGRNPHCQSHINSFFFSFFFCGIDILLKIFTRYIISKIVTEICITVPEIKSLHVELLILLFFFFNSEIFSKCYSNGEPRQLFILLIEKIYTYLLTLKNNGKTSAPYNRLNIWVEQV